MPCNAMGASAANARSHPASANASLGPSGPPAPANAPSSRQPPDDRNAGLRASAQRDVLLHAAAVRAGCCSLELGLAKAARDPKKPRVMMRTPKAADARRLTTAHDEAQK